MENTEVYKKIESYMSVILGFSEILEEENQALSENNVKKVASLYERKTKAVVAYRGLVAYFMKNQDALKGIDEEEKEELKEASFRLDNLLRENNMMLKAKMEASKTVMDSIISIAKVTTKANSTTSYGGNGHYSPLESRYNALSVNRTL